MAEYALVDGGIVRAVIVAEADFVSNHGAAAATTYGHAAGSWYLTPAKVGRGYSHDGSAFAAPTRGKSLSGAAAATSTTSGDTLSLNLNGDGAQTINLATSAAAADVAADIQAKVRALTAADSAKQAAYDSFSASWDSGATKYSLESGTIGQGGSVEATGGTAAAALKLGPANGGTESAGTGLIL